jgi:uncharacterized membrane protein YdjX (TVP38/TMEM64 family)
LKRPQQTAIFPAAALDAACILLAALFAAYATGLHEYLTLNAIADNRDSLIGFVKNNLVLSAIVLFMLTYMVAAVALSLPGASLLTILGGFLFGWMLGGVVTVVAATLGAVVIFLVPAPRWATPWPAAPVRG